MGSFGDVAGQGLGTLVRILDLATALRHGQLGTALARQANLITDPEARSAVEGSPFLSGFTGVYGHRYPKAVDLEPGGPSAPERQVGFHANLPDMPPNLRDALLSAQIDLTRARKPLVEAQTAGYSSTPPQGMVPLTYSQGKTNYGYPPAVTVPAGARDAEGNLLRPGGKTSSGRVVDVVEPTKQTEGQQKQANLLNSAVNQVNRMMTPIAGQGSPRPIDALTQSGGRAIASQYLPLGPISAKGNVETLATYANAKSIPRLVVAANGGDEGQVKLLARAAAQLLSFSKSVVLPIRRALGDTANAAVQEQLMTLEANSITGNETVGQAEEKLNATLETLRQLQAEGQRDPSVAAALGMSAEGGATTTTPGTSTTSTTLAPTPQQVKPRDVSAVVNDLNSMPVPGVTKIRRGR